MNPKAIFTLWKYDLHNATVKEVKCERPRYPNKDEDGDTIYDNSHFQTEMEAWEALESEARAWVRNSAANLENAREQEAKHTRDLADRSLILVKVQENLAKAMED